MSHLVVFSQDMMLNCNVAVATLVRKVRKYSKELETRQHHLKRLELSCDDEDIERWEEARKDLEEKRAKDPYYADEFWGSATVAPGELDLEMTHGESGSHS